MKFLRALWSAWLDSIRFDITGVDGTVYLSRWTVVKLGKWFAIRVHKFHRGDEDQELHDHPWSFLSIILRGGYFELTPDPSGAPVRNRRWYGRGSILWRPNPWPHRVDLLPGQTALTLVFTGPVRRRWGFHTACGWQHWRDFLAKKHSGAPICEDSDS